MRTALIIAIAGAVVVGAVWWISSTREPAAPPSQTAAEGGIAAQVQRLEQRRHVERPGWSGTTDELKQEGRAPAAMETPRRRRTRGQTAPLMANESAPPPGEATAAVPVTPHPRADFATLRSTALNDRSREHRIDALESVGDLDDQQALDVLKIGLNDNDREVRLAALNELWLAVDEPPIDVLAPVLDDSDPEVRLEALRMVGESEDPRARALVERALSDPNEEVRSDAQDIVDDLDFDSE